MPTVFDKVRSGEDRVHDDNLFSSSRSHEHTNARHKYLILCRFFCSRCQSVPLFIKQKIYKTRHLSSFRLKVLTFLLDKTNVWLSYG